MPRKLTLGERIARLTGSAHLSRSQRMQRTAIITMIVLLGVYLIVWPIFSEMLGGGAKTTTSPGVAAQNALGRRK